MPGLSVSDVIAVSINLAPTAAQYRAFGVCLIIGSSPVIDTTERIRSYTTLSGVASDFGSSAPEYLAAQAFFSQQPQPLLLKVGRWAQVATSGVLHGAYLGATQQVAALSTLAGISTGALAITIDGTPRTVTNLNFTAATSLNAIAGVIGAALSTWATVVWNGSRFDIRSNSTGTASTVGYATVSGTDIVTPLGLSQAAGASVPVSGIGAETLVNGVLALANTAADWYAAVLAPLTSISNSTCLQAAATIEGLLPARCIGFTSQESTALDPTSTTDLPAQLAASGYSRSTVQWSSSNPYAIAAFFGRALTVNFKAVRSTITMNLKPEIGIAAETFTESQKVALTGKNCNVYVTFANGTSALLPGKVSGGRFWDEVHGLDWLSNAVETDQWNTLYSTTTKIPQTDDGVHTLLTVLESTLAQAVTNGLVAPGVWNAEGFGQLKRGDTLPKGFYTYAQSVDTQSQADRDSRTAPPLMAAIKMAGAIHFVNVQINVNR